MQHERGGGLGFPDYSKISDLIPTSSSSGISATCPEDGWIIVRMQVDNNAMRTVTINGYIVVETRSGAEYLNGSEAGGIYPVLQGYVIVATRATVRFCPNL